MTTVAFDGQVLAADSRCSWGCTVVSDDACKLAIIESLNGRMLVGCGGRVEDLNRYVGWLKAGRHDKLELVDKDTFSAIVINQQGAWLDHGDGLFQIGTDKIAIGTGADHAMTAMDLGHDAIKAVEMAILRDTHSGGRVRACTLELGELTDGQPVGKDCDEQQAQATLRCTEDGCFLVEGHQGLCFKPKLDRETPFEEPCRVQSVHCGDWELCGLPSGHAGAHEIRAPR